MDPIPFTIAVPRDDLADLEDRLRRPSWCADFANEDGYYRTHVEYLRAFAGGSLSEYDWCSTDSWRQRHR